MNKRFSVFLRISISLLLIVILLYIMRDKYAEILASLKATDKLFFVAASLTAISAITLASVRLKLIVEAQDLAITFRESLALTFIGYFFNNFLPTTIGGDVVKAYYLARTTSERIGSFTSIFVDRAIGLITMVFMAVAALMLAKDQVVDGAVRYTIYAITAFALIGTVFVTSKTFAKMFSFLLIFFRPLEEQLKAAYNVIYKYKHHKILMFQSIVISIVSQLLFFSSLSILIVSIGSKIKVMDVLLRVPIISTVSLLPSINGLGLRESSTVIFFGPLIGKSNAFAVSILWLLILFMISVAGGIIYAVSPQFRINPLKHPSLKDGVFRE